MSRVSTEMERAREELLLNRHDLAKKAEEYVTKGIFEPEIRKTASGIVNQYHKHGKTIGGLTERQWGALASFVAYIEVADEDDPDDRENDPGDGRQPGNGW